ncbi:MAG: bifunctional 2-polyprenyl-6-hydroxyphenol methylase/3-demethylubiquinol 3-O-methyltransferase UbiG [Pseudomonadales bacterium]|nr:bifunctional 2-polyprenyl-6-hydroxyphenol methylase/3-demethylubiquinol 3-O-methyltransferase UbiG [Pseudomonadales bacterium]
MAEINNALYEKEAQTWWQEGSQLSQLQALNTGRFGYLDKVLNALRINYHDLKVLDIGCGGGFICEEFAKRSARTSGVDPSPATIVEASQHARKTGLDINYREGTGENLPFEDNSFDLISCCDVLEHVSDLEMVIQETARVLKPGGIYFYDTINRTFLSWLLMIKVVQDWPLTRRVPKNTHLWSMFIKPEELKSAMTKAELQLQHEIGLGIDIDWQGIPAAVAKAFTKRELSAALQPVQSGTIQSKQIIYMGWARNS